MFPGKCSISLFLPSTLKFPLKFSWVVFPIVWSLNVRATKNCIQFSVYVLPLYNFISQDPRQMQTSQCLPYTIHRQSCALVPGIASKFPFSAVCRAHVLDCTTLNFHLYFAVLHKIMSTWGNCIGVTKQGRMPFTYSILWECFPKIQHKLDLLDRKSTY